MHHFAGAPDTSLGRFRPRDHGARADLPCAVSDIPTAAYPTPARRPLNSRLDCTSLSPPLA